MKCKFCLNNMQSVNDAQTITYTWDLYKCPVCNAEISITIQGNDESRKWTNGDKLTDVIARILKEKESEQG